MSYNVATAALGRTDRGELIFEKEGVYLHTNAKRSNQETSIPGFIRVVERLNKNLRSSTILVRGNSTYGEMEEGVLFSGLALVIWAP
uniref:Uncharacterized protein n=1 Tax=Nothobranchius furzeri TaxID=105023 RepID=A0A8C6LJ68_NOTFU